MANFSSAAVILTDKILGYNSDPLGEVLKKIASEMDLSNIAHLRFNAERSEDITVLTAINTYPKEWQARYFLKQYSNIDPVVRFGVQATAPFDWDTLNRDDPAVREFFADAVRHNVGRHGMSIPVRNRKNSFSVISFSSELDTKEWEAYKASNMTDLQQLAVLIASAESADGGTLTKPAVQLSSQEERCLVWAAKGKTQQEIAEILDLSPGSVRTHLDSARRKLQCKNLAHAVGVAIATGVIPAAVLGDGSSS
jgi:DNA-binding CsgD family transcriptional regulator